MATELKSGFGVVETASPGVEDVGVEASESMDGRKEKGNAVIGSDDFCRDCAVGLVARMGAAAIGESTFPVLEDTGGDASEGRKEKGSTVIGSDDSRADCVAAIELKSDFGEGVVVKRACS